MDRLAPEEILLVLKLIRLCSDFELFVYVLAFDEKYVVRVINQQLRDQGAAQSGEEYLKKIVQMDVQLPAIDQSFVDAFVDRVFDELQATYQIEWGGDFNERFSSFYRDHLRGKVIRNLRDAKKLGNAVAFSLPLVKGEVNYCDWVVLETLRVFSPSAYALTIDNLHLLVPDDAMSGYLWSPNEKQEFDRKFKSLQDSIDGKLKDFAIGALEFLFPAFAGWKRQPANWRPPSPAEYVEYTKQQRIASPSYRATYFQFGAEPGRMPDTQIADFVDKVNSTPDADLALLLTNMMVEMKGRGRLKEFTDKLILRVDRINRAADASLVQTLAAQSDKYSTKREWLEDSEEDRIQALIYALVAQNTSTEQSQRLLVLAVEVAGGDAFAVRMVYFATPERNNIIERFEGIDQEKLRDRLRERLRKRYIEGNADIFKLQSEGYGLVLAQWAGPLLNDQANVVEYLTKLFRGTPKYIGKFAAVFLSETRPPSGVTDLEDGWRFDMADYKLAFKVDWLQALLEELPGPLFETERERRAIESFRASI